MKGKQRKDLERRFHQEMTNAYRAAKAECGYNATRFLRMLNELGGLGAARSLLRASKLSDGLVALWKKNRLDLTVEDIILHKPWRALFSDEELKTAEKRLDDLNYKSKSN